MVRTPTGGAPAFPWLDSRLDPAPGARCVTIGQRTVLFCERRQQLYELNETAAAIWRSLAAGGAPATAARDLHACGASAFDAQAFVAASVQAWLEAGLLLPAEIAARVRLPPKGAMSLQIGHMAVALDVHAAAYHPLRGELESVFGPFRAGPSTGAARLAVICQEDQAFLLRDGVPHGLFSAERLLPEVKALITDMLAHSLEAGAFLLHAALLARGGKGLLLSGPPGAGKSTLAVALTARGWGFCADDIVMVSAAGAFSGVPFSPAIKSGGWDLVQTYAPAIATRPTHLRGDGQRVRFLPIPGGPIACPALDWAVILDRRAEGRPALEPLEPLTLVTALIAGAYSPGHRLSADAFEALAERVGRADCRRLVYIDLAQALALIETLADG